MLLIGFGNKARNGKDTAAEAIIDFYRNQDSSRRKHITSYKGVRTGVFKYAGALYAEVNEQLKYGSYGDSIWNTRIVYTTDPDNPPRLTATILPDWVQPDPNPEISPLAPYGKHPKLLQWWGTEFRRNIFGQDYWVKKTFATIPANLDIALITDVRFPNEAEAIESRGGYTVNVKRLREDGTQYHDPSRPIDHISETALDNWNWKFRLVIPNGHVAYLEQQAVTLAEYLKGLHQ